MELINEINTIKNLMSLKVLNEAAPGAWLDDVWMVTKDILKTFFNRSSLDKFIKDGFGAQEFKPLKKAILDSPNRQLGVELKNSLTTAMNNLPETATAQRLLIATRIKQIDELMKSVVTKKLIKNTIQDLEKSYPNLFQKKWYGSFVNQGKINSITKQVTRDFEGKSAKDIETIIEKKLSDADTKLYNKKGSKKSGFQKLIKRYREYMIAHPIKGSASTLGGVVGIGTLVYLLYYLISNTIETGSPISGTIKTGSDIWGDIKKGWYSSKPYPNTPNGLLLYLTDKYGPNDYQNNFKLSPPAGGVVTITPINGGEAKSFEHNGKTFIEL
jgi:fido (protein-threonine AMPylation protein)